MTEILTALGLPPDLLRDGGHRTISLTDYFRILEQLSIATQDETCQLSSRPLIPGTAHFVLSGLSGCVDLHAAMKQMAKSFNVIHGGAYNRVERREDSLAYIIDDSEFPYAPGHDKGYTHFTMECVLILLHCMLSFIASADLSSRLLKIDSKQTRGRNGSQHLAFWDAPVRYGSPHYALVYHGSIASIPVAFAATELPSTQTIYSKVIAMIESARTAGFRERGIVSLVSEALKQGLRDQPRVARRLGLSVATLRRRLSRENTCFRHIHQEILNESAKSLLQRHVHISDVAEELGFSDFRSFARAFKRWNGVTPRVYVDSLGK